MLNYKTKSLIILTTILLTTTACNNKENEAENLEDEILTKVENTVEETKVIPEEITLEEKIKEDFLNRYNELYDDNKEIELYEIELIEIEDDSNQVLGKYSMYLDLNLNSDLNDNIPVIERTSANIAKELTEIDLDEHIQDIKFIWSLNDEEELGNIIFERINGLIELKEINFLN